MYICRSPAICVYVDDTSSSLSSGASATRAQVQVLLPFAFSIGHREGGAPLHSSNMDHHLKMNQNYYTLPHPRYLPWEDPPYISSKKSLLIKRDRDLKTALFCICFLRKGELLAYVGSIQNLTDLKIEGDGPTSKRSCSLRCVNFNTSPHAKTKKTHLCNIERHIFQETTNGPYPLTPHN